MGEIRVQDEKGITHVFPEGSTPEMIAKAMKVKPPTGKPKLSLRQDIVGKNAPKGGNWDTYVNALPTAAGVGFAAAASETGPGAIPMAGLGFAAGESAKELIQRRRGRPSPTTSGAATKEIGKQFAIGVATEGAGQVLALPLRMFGKQLSETAAASAANKVPLLPSEAVATSRPVLAWFERFASGALPSKKVMEAFRARQAAAIDELAADTITNIGKASGQEATGDAVVNALEKSRLVLRTQQNQMYAEIDRLTESEIKRVPKSVETPSRLVDEQGQPMTYAKKVMEKTRVGGVQPSTRPLRPAAIKL